MFGTRRLGRIGGLAPGGHRQTASAGRPPGQAHGGVWWTWLLALLAGLAVAAPAEASFPGASGKIAFASTRDGNYEIYTMNRDGSEQTRLTRDSGFDLAPSWSPDGTKIAFETSRDGAREIYVMNADGSNPTRLTDDPSFDLYPTWSPDGTKIAFASMRTGNYDIYVMNADGSDETRLTTTGFVSEPTWSPDGARIAFRRPATGTYEEIYVMNADGSNPTRLTYNDVEDGFAEWSPDGTRIVYSSRDAARNYQIWVMNADGSAQTRLSTSTAHEAAPAWSPDGTRIAFSSNRDGDAEIFLMDTDGSNLTRLTSNAALDANADWQRLLNRPPDCSAVTATPATLERHNHEFELVTLSGATDPDGDPVSLSITGVTQDEPVVTQGDDTAPDAQRATAPHEVYLRAERNPKGDGRVYRIAYIAADGEGGTCSGTATVNVARKQGDVALDSGTSHDSFAAVPLP